MIYSTLNRTSPLQLVTAVCGCATWCREEDRCARCGQTAFLYSLLYTVPGIWRQPIDTNSSTTPPIIMAKGEFTSTEDSCNLAFKEDPLAAMRRVVERGSTEAQSCHKESRQECPNGAVALGKGKMVEIKRPCKSRMVRFSWWRRAGKVNSRSLFWVNVWLLKALAPMEVWGNVVLSLFWDMLCSRPRRDPHCADLWKFWTEQLGKCLHHQRSLYLRVKALFLYNLII